MKKYLIVLMILSLVVGLNSCCKLDDQKKLEELNLEVYVSSGTHYSHTGDAYVELSITQGSLTRSNIFLQKGAGTNTVDYLYEETKVLYGFNNQSPINVKAKGYNGPILINITGIEHLLDYPIVDGVEILSSGYLLQVDSASSKEVEYIINIWEK